MSAKILAKGTIIINKGTMRTVIYGDVIEGDVKNGMFVHIPFNSSFLMSCEIESVEFIDIVKEKKSYVALVLKPDENPNEETEFINGLNIGEEILIIEDNA